MREENAIEVRNLTKDFKVYLDKGSQLKEKMLFRNRRRYENRHVLRGVSFDVKKGEAVGLIGHNGCGKSTTLKLLSRIIYPNSGSVEMRGRVSSLIELGAGFHPDMSGRENIYTNASIFGLTKKEIDARVDSIIEFSELEDFIDNPVRTYSSGMYMRLAFSVAINVDADILLIDEILAVGDASFQAKCFRKMREIKSQGTTIVLVSHAMAQIEQICDRCIWIHEGLVREDGLPREVDPHYMQYMSDESAQHEKSLEIKKSAAKKNKEETHKVQPDQENATLTQDDSTNKCEGTSNDTPTQNNESEYEVSEKDVKRWGSGEARMARVWIENAAGEEQQQFLNREELTVCIDYEAKKEISDVVIGIAIYREDQTYIYGTNTLIDYSRAEILRVKGTIRLDIEQLALNAGNYTIDLAFHRPDGFNYDFWREACMITIINHKDEAGIISPPHRWSIE